MTDDTQRLAYQPDHASPPGELIQEHLETLGISARELARRCGRSGKLMAEITAGKAPIEPETALQLERVLNIPATVWIRMEAAYQLHRAREAETATLAASYPWASQFPLRELSERKFLTRTNDKSAQVRELLKFFGVGNLKACEERLGDLLAVDFRTSTSFKNDNLSLAAWLRIGELRAAGIETADYDREKFIRALREIRELSLIPIELAITALVEKCAAAGVAFVLEKGLPKIRASGITRWLTPRKALIQQSLRYKSDDHFWFTFFHEAAHILLHSRKEIFIDMTKGPGSADPKHEAEANVWAADFLVPAAAMRGFVLTFAGGEDEVRQFSARQKIAPGIVVGQLQHNGVISYAALNGLKARYEWSDD